MMFDGVHKLWSSDESEAKRREAKGSLWAKSAAKLIRILSDVRWMLGSQACKPVVSSVQWLMATRGACSSRLVSPIKLCSTRPNYRLTKISQHCTHFPTYFIPSDPLASSLACRWMWTFWPVVLVMWCDVIKVWGSIGSWWRLEQIGRVFG